MTRRHGDERVRVLGFERVELQPGVSRQVTVTADPRLLATFDGTAGQWRIAEGIHRIPLAHRADEPVRGRSIDQQADS
jgi:beta-glucosidase